MKLADLLKLANETLAAKNKGNGWWVVRAETLATAISSLLSAETCGWERPVVNVDSLRRIGVPDSWAADVSPADARVLAVMLLVAADSAEENQ